jgi:IclR family acetate operon transcriptional repressor
MGTTSQGQIIQSLDRGLAIMQTIAQLGRPVSIARLAETLQIDHSSVFRLVKTLEGRGFVAHDIGHRSYVLGPAVWRLSEQSTWIQNLVDMCRERLMKLAEDTGETAHIAVLQGKESLIVDNEMGNRAIGVAIHKGTSGLLHCLSVAKALMVDFDREQLSRLLGQEPFPAMTRNTITSLDGMVDEIRKTKRRGYAVDDEEYHRGIRCLGAPIRDGTNNIVAGISISAPVDRLPRGRFKEVGEVVMRAAADISEKLGCTPDV